MKNLILLPIILFFFQALKPISADGQIVNGEAVYHVESLINFGLIDTITNDDLRHTLKKTETDSKNSLDVLYSLKFNQDHSLFQYVEVGKDIEERTFNLPLILARKLGKIYTDLHTGEILHHQEFNGEQFIVKSNLKDYDWNLDHDEKKQIGKYPCSKATLAQKMPRDSGEFVERIIEAWYTPEIEISTGPMGFGGLPGLILELREGDEFIYYLAQVSQSNTSEDIIKPDTGKEMMKDEYDKLLAEHLFNKLRKHREKYPPDNKKDNSGFRLFEDEN